LAAASLLFAACTGGKKKDKEPPVTIVSVDDLPEIVEAHGRVGDGSSMNVLQLVKDDGDTLDIVAGNQSVTGGLIVGNEVDVVYTLVQGDPIAQVVVNTTALQHLWSQLNEEGKVQSLELDSRGRASTYGMTIDYERWNIQDGLLLLHSPRPVGDERPADVDTFQIMLLTEDSLVLMSPNAPVASAFYRDN
jgi:hypothetical protein